MQQEQHDEPETKQKLCNKCSLANFTNILRAFLAKTVEPNEILLVAILVKKK
jgi:hypothetical protein